MIDFTLIHPRATLDHLGLLPEFWSEDAPGSAKLQAHVNYAHGGGWHPFNGFKMLTSGRIQYPGDAPLELIAEAKLREETIRIYDGAWVAIVQPDGSFEVSRMD